MNTLANEAFQPNTECSFDCDIIFKTYQEFREHNLDQHLKTCMQCGIHFPHFDMTQDHIKTVHVLENDWNDICKFCGLQTNNLDEHIQQHNFHLLDDIYCYSCKMLFENEIAIEVHYAVVKHEYRYQCIACDETFMDRQLYRQHKSKHTTFVTTKLMPPQRKCQVRALSSLMKNNFCGKSTHQQTIFECPICEHKFGRKYNMEKHVGLHRRDNFCRVCGLSFVTDSALQKHMGGSCKPHLKMKFETTIVCPKTSCHQTFRSRFELYHHEKVVHLQMHTVKCPDCDLEFKSTSIMETHRKLHSQAYVCTVCDKKFSQHHQLRAHETVHTGDRPFECDICMEKFRHHSNLYQHKLSHANTRKYKCLNCDSEFMRANTFREHMRTHAGERPYQCEICCKKYTQLCVLKRHMESMHRRCSLCKTVVGNKMKLQVHMWKMHPLSDTDGKGHIDYLADEQEDE